MKIIKEATAEEFAKYYEDDRTHPHIKKIHILDIYQEILGMLEEIYSDIEKPNNSINFEDFPTLAALLEVFEVLDRERRCIHTNNKISRINDRLDSLELSDRIRDRIEELKP